MGQLVAGIRGRPGDELGSLSAKYESNHGPGAVSPGVNDPGGISYGSYQLSSRKGMATAFVASPEFSPWAREFTGLEPGTDAFSDRWRTVAARDPEAFRTAQHMYVGRERYDRTLGRVEKATRYNFNDARDAIRNAAWSVSMQHGQGAAIILSDATKKTDEDLRRINPYFRRSDPDYERRLIDNVYDRRSEYVAAIRDKYLARGALNKAQEYINILKNRYPRERSDAHHMLDDQQ
jgi:hypothetical protein